MMETVEDIPKDAILNGLPWSWEDYGGYLDAVEELQPGVNVAGLIGHCALRFYVMGERGVEEQATDEEKKQMADIVARAVDAGAVGFSTNRYPPHVLPDGRAIPGTYADASELLEIAKVVGERGALMQNVLDWTQGEFTMNLVRDMAKLSRVLFSFGAGPDPQSGKAGAALLDRLAEGGADVSAVTQPRGSGFIMSLETFMPVRGATWKELSEKDLAGRLAAIDDPAFVARLCEEADKPGRSIPPEQMFFMGAGDTPDYTAPSGEHIGAAAKAAGEHWVETFVRLSKQNGGKGRFTFRQFNANLDALGDLLKSEHMFPILGDAGAHVSQIMDAGWASFVLSHWVRERGLFTMGEAIRRMTTGPARIIGLTDRGLLMPGMRADVNVFDADAVTELQPEIVHDFPGGAPRYIQRSKGYRATLVNGRVNVRDGEHTGTRAGQVLRHQA